MKLYELEGKMVRIETTDGQFFQGEASDYTSAWDNDSEEESITIGHVELYASEIAKIEILL